MNDKNEGGDLFIRKQKEKMIDIGANLGKKYSTEKLESVLLRASEAGLSHIVITGTSMAASREAIQLCKNTNLQQNAKEKVALRCTVGVHPHDAGRTLQNKNWERDLRELITSNKGIVVATGECGLDFDRNFSTPDDQIKVFRAQMEIAKDLGYPVFLHNRDAHDKFVEILKDYPTVKKVVHCHTDPSEKHLKELLDMDCFIGITGWVCENRKERMGLANIVNKIPLNRLMIETDAPFLIPRNMPRGAPRENEPAFLGWVVKKLSECYGLSEDEIAIKTTQTSKSFFNIE